MSIDRVAVIFDNTLRPDTTGTYCRRALGRLVDVEHFLPRELGHLRREKFDLYLAIDDGLNYSIPPGLHPLAYWAIDTHVDFELRLRRARAADFVFAAQRDGSSRLRQEGIATATWLPLACDPEIHGRQPVAKEYDVCFVGNIFPGPREELLTVIRETFPRSFVGRRFFTEMARTYSASRIIFNRSLRNDVNMRFFEALASGSLLVTNDLRENGQHELFQDGKHLATYADERDLVETIRHYLDHEEERERVAEAGRQEVLQRHTYLHRMQTILSQVEGRRARRTPPARPAAPCAAVSQRTSIVIVTHNQLDYTRICLESIRRRTAEPYELIVVDNGSKDGTVDWLRQQKDIRLIANSKNCGFPAAANQGLLAAEGDTLLLLNNDTVVTTGWLRRLLAALDRSPEIGLVGPSSNRVSGPQQVAVDYKELKAIDGFAHEWARQHSGHYLPADRLVGFCLLFRREVVERIGLLDEQFGIGNFEDDDFCRRAIQTGFRAEIAVDAFVHHFGHATFIGSGVDFAALMAENQRKYEAKWGDTQRVESVEEKHEAFSSFPGSTRERDAGEAPPAVKQIVCSPCSKSRQSLEAGAFPGGAGERESPKPLLSLCMIVRDNETTIGPCLASIRPWVDEIVVVDTGSTDRTPEICREYGARMFDFAWCDDFSAARNESLKHARGEWIFWMDSDDTIPDECGRKLRALVDSLVAESLRDSAAASTDLQPRPSHGSGRATPPGRRTQLEGPKVHSTSAFLGYVMQVHCPGPGEEGAHDVTVVDHVKLLRNRPHLRFEGRIHEQLLPAIRRAGSEVAWTDIYVVHSGSDHSPDGFQRKLQRDLRILARELTERPDHPFVLFNLGMTYADAKRYDEAIDYLTRCIAVSTPDESHLRKAYALLVSSLSQADRHDEAWEMCQRGRALYRDDKELLFRLAMLQHHFGRLPEAEKSYLAVLYGNEERHFTSVDRQLAGNKARHNLAVVYDDMGLHEKSAAQWQAILDATRDYLPAWRGLAEALLKLGRYDCLVRLVEEMQSTPDLRLTGWTIQARLLERRGDLVGARRALESALHEVPDAVEPLQELCRFLFEHGEFDEAERALRRLTECSPGDASAWHNLGTIYCQLARYDEAAAAYRKSLAIRPNAEPTLQQLTFAVSRVERNMSPATSA